MKCSNLHREVMFANHHHMEMGWEGDDQITQI